jgi:ADP-ribose pyrophosphatase YjhB (NUDIX family)
MCTRFTVIGHPLLFQDDKISLLRLINAGHRDGDSVPPGYLDGGESVKALAAPEAKEKAGLQLE